MKSRAHLLLIAMTCAVCVGLAQTAQGHRLLGAAGIYEEPATYTELAFSMPGALPNTLPTSTASVRVSFGIQNVSSSPRSYSWSIVLMRSGVSKVNATGTVVTAAQGRATVTKSIVPGCTNGRVQVVVRLLSPNQSISFWLTCPSARTKTSQ